MLCQTSPHTVLEGCQPTALQVHTQWEEGKNQERSLNWPIRRRRIQDGGPGKSKPCPQDIMGFQINTNRWSMENLPIK